MSVTSFNYLVNWLFSWILGSEGILFFTSNQEIRGYYLDSEVYFKVVENLPHATGVSYDGVNVYWTTVADEEETIVKAAENGENQKIIVTSGAFSLF